MAEYRRRDDSGRDVFIRDGWLYAIGDNVPPHDHNFDHWTRCTDGRIAVSLVMPDGSDIGHELGPDDEPILVPAEAMHSITAIDENSRYECEYLHRAPTGAPVSRFNGWVKAYR